MRGPERTLIAIGALAFGTLAPAGFTGAGVARAQGEDSEADTLRYQLRGELGVELDSNARRTEEIKGASSAAPVSSLVQRVVVSGAFVDTPAPGHEVAVAATAAAKGFDAADARAENVAIAQSSLAWRAALGARGRLALAGSYYEAFQNPDAGTDRRDFRSLAPGLQLGRALGDSWELSVGAGYRMFVFKADGSYDFTAPTAGADLRWTPVAQELENGADWDVGAGAAFERRDFAGTALVACDPPSPTGLPCPGTEGRLDHFVLGHAEVTRTGRVLTSVGYALHYNTSNSYGESVTRHFAILRFAASLPLAIYVTARADLLFARYDDPVTVGQATTGNAYVSIEDENRSSLRLDLARDFGERLRAFARYTFYANELGSDSLTYRRHTLLLSLAFMFEK
jgi:hypothetical protein